MQLVFEKLGTQRVGFFFIFFWKWASPVPPLFCSPSPFWCWRCRLSPRKLAVASVSLGFKGEQAGQVKLDLLHATLELVCRFGALYRQHEAVTELFADAKYYAEALPMQSLPAETRVLVEKIASGTAFGGESEAGGL